MRGDDERALEVVQEPLEPDDRLDVEVVRRLVEQERVRTHQEDARERDPHLPASRELADVLVDDVRREPEPGEDLTRPRLEPIAAELVEARLHVPEPLDVALELLGSFGVRHRPLERVELPRHVRHLACPGHRLRDDALARHLADVLAEVPDRDVAVGHDVPDVGLLLAHDEPEDRRLARAVRAHEPDLLATKDTHRRLEKEDLLAVLLGDRVETDHGARSSQSIAPDARTGTKDGNGRGGARGLGMQTSDVSRWRRAHRRPRPSSRPKSPMPMTSIFFATTPRFSPRGRQTVAPARLVRTAAVGRRSPSRRSGRRRAGSARRPSRRCRSRRPSHLARPCPRRGAGRSRGRRGRTRRSPRGGRRSRGPPRHRRCFRARPPGTRRTRDPTGSTGPARRRRLARAPR